MPLPQTMNAIEITEPGAPQVLKLATRPVPVPGQNQVLIKVSAAGVNRPDCLQRLGHYPAPDGASDIPGLEVSGNIVALGEGVAPQNLNRNVMALITGGGYAEFAVAELDCVLPIPGELTMIEAAAIPETYFTVWHNVFQLGGLAPDQVLLVHGGSSGIGTTAIQLAKAVGAKIIVTAGSKEKCEACINLGADLAINYTIKDYVKEVNDFTLSNGADVILDMVGGDYIDRNYYAAAIEGRIVQIAFLGGAKAKVNFAKLMTKRLVHTGSTLRARPTAFKAMIAGELEKHVWPMLEQGVVKPIIATEYSLDEAHLAHQHMEDGAHIGKIVLSVS